MTFVNRLDSLLKDKNLTRSQFLTTMHFGKNQITYWEKNNTLPNVSTLNAIASFFGVSVEYLRGAEQEEGHQRRIISIVVDWLTDHDCEYIEEENGSVCLSKNGEDIHLAMSDFATECIAIKKRSEDGFDLAMQDWERRHFSHQDVTSRGTGLSKQELELIKLYREFSLEEQNTFISYALRVKNGEV